MTNEQASEILDDYDVNFHGHTAEEVAQAFDCAFKALKQEPCGKYIKEIDHLRKYICKLETQIVEQQPCEDAISRQALKDLGAECIAKRDENGNLIPLGCIDNLPSVSTEKTGRWKRVSIDKYIQHAMAYYKCSECGGQTIGQTEYCPNCGAKMEVEE